MKVIIICMLLIFSSAAKAQTWSEWFRQKKTQRKYLLEQIAALQTYLGYVKKGYSIAKEGLGAIEKIKKGDFQLHDDYFESLKLVNPKVQRYSKVASIVSYQLQIIKQTKEAMASITEAGQFAPDEIEYCKRTFDNLLTESLKNIEEIILLVTSYNFEMKDSERLERIDALYLDMQEKYSFCASMSEEMALLAVQRMREAHDIELSRKLNGLK